MKTIEYLALRDLSRSATEKRAHRRGFESVTAMKVHDEDVRRAKFENNIAKMSTRRFVVTQIVGTLLFLLVSAVCFVTILGIPVGVLVLALGAYMLTKSIRTRRYSGDHTDA